MSFPSLGSLCRPRNWAEMKTFDSLGDLLDQGIAQFKSDAKGKYFFRGECAFFADPNPGLFRNPKFVRNENQIFQSVLNAVPALFENCPTTFDKLYRAAHYGFPTRILDISADLAMAWFMAVDGWRWDEVADSLNKPGGIFFCPRVLVIRVPEKREKFEDSDLVAGLSAVARMKNEFNRGKLIYEVQQERRGFQEKYFLPALKTDFSKNWMVYPRMSNPRVQRQKGAFVLCGLTEENCAALDGGDGKAFEAVKDRKSRATGLCYPKIAWDLQRRTEEISICGCFVLSAKYFREVSEAAAAGTRSFADAKKIRGAVDDFKKKVFEELKFVGGGETDAYADDFARHAGMIRAAFAK